MIGLESQRRSLVAWALAIVVVAAIGLAVTRSFPSLAALWVPAPQPVARLASAIATRSFDDQVATVGGHSPIEFTDVSPPTGIRFRHHDGGSGHKYLVEPGTAGVALFDYDGDGLIDIYFVSGRPLPPAPSDLQAGNALYRNEGNWQFRDVTYEAGVAGTEFGMGVTVGDYDNDGDPDLFVNNFGRNTLYRNNGDGTFSDVSAPAGAAGGKNVGAGANFLDFDADSDLDLFVANYVKFDLTMNPRRFHDGNPVYPGPLDFDPFPSVLLENLGDGSFRDVSESSRIGSVPGNGMGTICFDYDQDGDTDVFVANDEMANFLWENDGRGTFTEVAIPRGLAYNLDGQPKANMGLDCTDFDGDGWLDVISTTYRNELPILFRNNTGSFDDVTRRSGDLTKAIVHVKWGVGFGDFDSDGLPDLIIACGDLDQEVHRWKPSTAFRVPNVLLRNLGNGAFEDLSSRSGTGLSPAESSRGLGLDDLDNDGDLDVVVLNSISQSTIIRNDSKSTNHWLQLELRGTAASRDAIGAQVRVTAGGRTRLAEVMSGRGFQSHFGTRLHFGLGKSDRAEQIEVRWHGGGKEVWTNIAANQRLLLIQGAEAAISRAP